MTADYTFEATPGQAAAIERDGFLVVAGPTTKPCAECVGGLVAATPGQPGDGYERCPTCNGDGTAPIVVDVVVPERAACQDCTNGFVMGLYGPEDCICDQGFVSLCLRCGQPYEMDHSPVKYGGVPVAQHRDRRGSKTVECPDGSGWIIPARTLLRGTAEAVPVVEDCDDVPDTPSLVEVLGPNVIRYWMAGMVDTEDAIDVSHHFADVPRPGVGDTAWIIRADPALQAEIERRRA